MALLKGMRHPHIVLTFGGTTGNAPAGGIDTPGGGGGEGSDADRPKKAGKRFYAMEYLPGGTLQDELDAGGPLPPTRVVRLARQICDALAFAHGRGVIHRDLKPGNFLLDADGTLKLADFGLAAVREGSKLTAEGRTMGTFRYMAPEQIRGKPPACPQTDLYALGVVLFELLTGRPPYRGETPAETLQMHLKAPVPRVVAFEPHCPPDLDRLVADLMEKRIEDRPPDAAAVADRLAQIAGGAGGGLVVTAGTAAETAGGAIELRSAPKRSLPTAAPARPKPRPAARAKPAVAGDADELLAAPAKRSAVPPAAWVTWTAAAALAGLAVAAVWLPSAAADAAALRRAETRWLTRAERPGHRRPRVRRGTAGGTGGGRPREPAGPARRRRAGGVRRRGAVRPGRRRRRAGELPGVPRGREAAADPDHAGGRRPRRPRRRDRLPANPRRRPRRRPRRSARPPLVALAAGRRPAGRRRLDRPPRLTGGERRDSNTTHAHETRRPLGRGGGGRTHRASSTPCARNGRFRPRSARSDGSARRLGRRTAGTPGASFGRRTGWHWRSASAGAGAACSPLVPAGVKARVRLAPSRRRRPASQPRSPRPHWRNASATRPLAVLLEIHLVIGSSPLGFG